MSPFCHNPDHGTPWTTPRAARRALGRGDRVLGALETHPPETAQAAAPAGTKTRATPCEAGLRGPTTPLERQDGEHDPVLLEQVRGRVALGGTRLPRPADVAHRDPGRRLLEPAADRPPGAHVLRLLLRPDDLIECWVRRDQLAGDLNWERVQLLDPGDGHTLGCVPFLVADDVLVDLPPPDRHPPDPRLATTQLIDHPVEA